MKQLIKKISYLSHRCWKILNQKEVKPWIVTSFKCAKENVSDCVTEKRITKKIDHRTHRYYKSLEEVKVRIKKLKLRLNWIADLTEDVVTQSKHVDLFTVPKFLIQIDDSLSYTIQIFDWLLSDDHELYNTCKRSVKNITISILIYKLNNVNTCLGIETRELSGKLTYHVILNTRND